MIWIGHLEIHSQLTITTLKIYMAMLIQMTTMVGIGRISIKIIMLVPHKQIITQVIGLNGKNIIGE